MNMEVDCINLPMLSKFLINSNYDEIIVYILV